MHWKSVFNKMEQEWNCTKNSFRFPRAGPSCHKAQTSVPDLLCGLRTDDPNSQPWEQKQLMHITCFCLARRELYLTTDPGAKRKSLEISYSNFGFLASLKKSDLATLDPRCHMATTGRRWAVASIFKAGLVSLCRAVHIGSLYSCSTGTNIWIYGTWQKRLPSCW